MSSEPIDLGIPGLHGLERIGAGGNAVVYRARQPELDRNVVVKVLMAVDADATRRRFDRERRAMGRLSQAAGIAPVYDSGFTPAGQPYLIMPFYERGSLQEWLDTRERLAPAEVRSIGVSICRAVQTAHESGVVHRDLKPANILMAKSGRPDVADFGIAQLLDDSGGASQALTMTPLYTAPEVFDGVDSGTASDIYSLGALLFALLNGRPAYSDESGRVPMLSLMRRINEDPLPALPPTTPAGMAAVITKAMDKNPLQRHRTAGEMAAALEAVDVTPPESKRKRPYALMAAAVVVLVAAIVAAVLIATLRTGDEAADEDTPPATAVPSVGATPTADSTPEVSQQASFDTAVAVAAAKLAHVEVEAFSCTGVQVAPGVALPGGRVLTEAKVLRSPWLISANDGDGIFDATPLTSDRNRSLAMVRVATSNVFGAPPLAMATAGTSVVVMSPGGDFVEAELGQNGELNGQGADTIEPGDVVVNEAGGLVGIADLVGDDPRVLTIEQLDREWTRSPPVFACPSLARDLGTEEIDQLESPDIIELMQMQRLSNAYADEEWDLVRELEPGKASLTDQDFIAGWRPLRQGYIYPVHRGQTPDGVARWRIGLIGEETWAGRDLTTLFCVTWHVDDGTVIQTNEDTIRIYGSQPGQPQREGFVDPGSLRVLIDQNCPLGP